MATVFDIKREALARWIADFAAKSLEALMARLDEALRWVIDRAQDHQQTRPITVELSSNGLAQLVARTGPKTCARMPSV